MSDLLESFIAAAAEKLGETEADPIRQLRRLVETLGPEQVATLVKEACALQDAGGMWIFTRERKRTLGGIFFFRARRLLTKAQRRYVFPQQKPPTTEPPEDESEGSAQSLETGARTAGDTSAIIAPKLKPVNVTAERRYDATPPTPQAR